VNKTQASQYEIRVQGHLAQRRLCCFDNLTITYRPNGETNLVGAFRDQSALYGLLNHICNLGVTLVSVKRATRSGRSFKCGLIWRVSTREENSSGPFSGILDE
jgi:hypothetical protein